MTVITIGFKLYKKFSKYAEQLITRDVLDTLEAIPTH